MNDKSEWLRNHRERKRFTQERLAAAANVSIRTVQRAERGENIRQENWLDFEEVLGVPLPKDSRKEEKEAPLPGPGSVLLRRLESGKVLIQELKQSDVARLGCDIEPTKDSIELIKETIRFIEARLPTPEDVTGEQKYRPQSLADELDDIASLTDFVERLAEIGASIYWASSNNRLGYPCYNPYIEYQNYELEFRTVLCTNLMIASSLEPREPFHEIRNWGLPEEEAKFDHDFDDDDVPF